MLRGANQEIGVPGLLDGGQVVEVLLEGLVVLALDLQLGLELFDQEFETGDFGFQFDDVRAWDGRTETGRGWRSGRRRRGGARRKGFG